MILSYNKPAFLGFSFFEIFFKIHIKLIDYDKNRIAVALQATQPENA